MAYGRMGYQSARRGHCASTGGYHESGFDVLGLDGSSECSPGGIRQTAAGSRSTSPRSPRGPRGQSPEWRRAISSCTASIPLFPSTSTNTSRSPSTSTRSTNGTIPSDEWRFHCSSTPAVRLRISRTADAYVDVDAPRIYKLDGVDDFDVHHVIGGTGWGWTKCKCKCRRDPIPTADCHSPTGVVPGCRICVAYSQWRRICTV